MAFLFRQKQRPDLASRAKELLPRLWENPPSLQAEEALPKILTQMKLILQGTQDTESIPEQVAHLVDSIFKADVLYLLARSIHLLPFESRKDTQTIFSYVLRFRPPGPVSSDPPTDPIAVSYIVNERPEVITELCRGYENRESAMPCGIVLREALKHQGIAVIILYDQSGKGEKATRTDHVDATVKQTGEGVFWQFFTWVDRCTFEVSTDAFTTFREILTRHKKVVSYYLSVNFDLFFSRFHNTLVQSSSYVTKRQSIKLLGEILLDRENYNVMTEYVDKGDHLKLCMMLLKDDRKMVQYEGFHVFKVFVANPKKSIAVQKILLNNRERLLKFLPEFLEDRTEDDQFTDEKSFLIRQIETMPRSPVDPVNE